MINMEYDTWNKVCEGIFNQSKKSLNEHLQLYPFSIAEFQNKSNRLALKLLIGPGEVELREELFNITHQKRKIFKGMRKKNSMQYTQIYA